MQCVSHARAEATRQCGQCQRAWCAACVKQLTIGGNILEVCARCNGRLREPYQAPAPRALDLGELVARAFTTDGLITAAAMSLPILLATLVGWIPGMGWFVALMGLVYWGTLVGFYFQVIAHVGDDKAGLPGPADVSDDRAALFAMWLRGVVCIAVGALPYLAWVYGLHDGGTPRAPLTAALLILVGLAYTPAIVVSVVITHSTLGALYPLAWVKIIARAPRSYAQLVGLFVAAFVPFGVVTLVTGAIPVVGDYLGTVATTLLWTAQACVVGGFLRRHADEFGWS
jgi:hypothetical protein